MVAVSRGWGKRASAKALNAKVAKEKREDAPSKAKAKTCWGLRSFALLLRVR